jgi:glycosyltransferase involved in cell wall biosynthesis
MIIGIDGNEANVENRVGVNVYCFNLLHNLQKINENKQNPNYLIVYLKNRPLFDMPNPSKYFEYKILGDAKFWVLTKLTKHLLFNSEKINILFTPSHYTTPFVTIPKVCSIMDLKYLENPTTFKKFTFWQLKYWTAISVFVSKRVLSISNDVKNDIVRHYPFASKKIQVTHLSHDLKPNDFNVSDEDVRRIKKKYSIVDDYILYLGTLKPSKNIDGLIKAYGILHNTYSTLQLVIAGKKGWLYESLFSLVEELGLKDGIIFTDFFPEDEKAILRRGARVFVQPSHTEGFGIDTLSMMALGVPVVVSKVDSLSEIVKDAGVYVDQNDPESIATGIEKVLKLDKNEYTKLVTKGKIQASKFSWEKCATQTLEILENAGR